MNIQLQGAIAFSGFQVPGGCSVTQVTVNGVPTGFTVDPSGKVTTFGLTTNADTIYGIALTGTQTAANALKHKPRALIFGCSIAAQSGIAFAGLNNAGPDQRSGTATFTASAVQTLAQGAKVAFCTYTGEVETNTIASAVSASTSMPLTVPTKRLIRASAAGTWSSYTTDQPSGIRQGIGLVTGALAFLGWPADVINPTYGYGGATLQQLVQDLPAYLARTRPEVVFLHLLENSIPVDDWTTVIKPLLGNAIRQCRKFGAVPFVFSSVPSTTFNTAGICTTFDQQNAYINGGGLLADFPYAVPVDVSNPWLDRAQLVNNKRQPIAGISSDGIHPDGNTRYTVAAYVAPQIAPYLPAGSNAAGTPGALNANPAMTGTTGTLSNATGTVATSYSLTGEAGVTAVGSKNADGSQKVVMSVAGASNLGTTRTLFNNTALTLPINFGPTSALRARVKVRVNSQANMSLIQPQIVFSGGETHSVGQNETNWVIDPAIVGQVLTLESAPVPVPNGATTAQLQLLLRPQTLGSPSGVTLDVDVISFELEPSSVL